MPNNESGGIKYMAAANVPQDDRLRRTRMEILKVLAESWLEQVVPGGRLTIDIAKVINKNFGSSNPEEAVEALRTPNTTVGFG